MPKIELLNSKKHGELGLVREIDLDSAYSCAMIAIAPIEICEAQREYPILLQKNSETGQLFPCVLLGFKQNENLYLSESGKWLANYIPLAIMKGPFLMGPESTESEKLVFFIDVEDPRVSTGAENKIFSEDGLLSESMSDVAAALGSLQQSMPDINKMVEIYTDLELIEPLTLDIHFKNGESLHFDGVYTVAEEKLCALSDKQLDLLNKNGFLSTAFFIANSLNNIKKLIDIKNASAQTI